MLIDFAFVDRLMRATPPEQDGARAVFEVLLGEYEAGTTVLYCHAAVASRAAAPATRDVLAVAVALRVPRGVRRAATRLVAEHPATDLLEAQETVLMQRHRIDETASEREKRTADGRKDASATGRPELISAVCATRRSSC